MIHEKWHMKQIKIAFIMRKKGNIKRSIKDSRRLHLANDELLDLMEGTFSI